MLPYDAYIEHIYSDYLIISSCINRQKWRLYPNMILVGDKGGYPTSRHKIHPLEIPNICLYNYIGNRIVVDYELGECKYQVVLERDYWAVYNARYSTLGNPCTNR